MHSSTPEQAQLVRKRKRIWLLVCLTIGFVVVATPLIVLKVFTAQSLNATARALFEVWIPYGWIAGFILIGIFTRLYWRCPVCRHSFSKRSCGKFCEYCDTTFAA